MFKCNFILVNAILITRLGFAVSMSVKQQDFVDVADQSECDTNPASLYKHQTLSFFRHK
jgi:hypothetical protein